METLESEILKLAMSQGIFAVLFVVLLFYVLRENAKREDKYQQTIDKLAGALDTVDDIKEDVGKILEKVEGER